MVVNKVQFFSSFHCVLKSNIEHDFCNYHRNYLQNKLKPRVGHNHMCKPNAIAYWWIMVTNNNEIQHEEWKNSKKRTRFLLLFAWWCFPSFIHRTPPGNWFHFSHHPHRTKQNTLQRTVGGGLWTICSSVGCWWKSQKAKAKATRMENSFVAL